MSVLLGGRAAEELVFGSITTGAADDLHRVAEISRSMVHDYAMGTSITSRKVSAEGGQVSDRTRQLRDEEQQHLSDEALRGAMKLISDHRTQARPARQRAAAQRGARAQGHRPDHGGRAALPPVARPGPAGRRRGTAPTSAGTRTPAAHRASGQPSGTPQVRPLRADARGDGRPPVSPCAVDRGGRRLPRSCSRPGRSARSSSRSSGSPTCSRSATRAWPASRRRRAWSRCRRTSRSPPPAGSGVRDELEVACWAAISEAGTPPAGRLLFVNVAPEALGHPGLLELAGRAARAARDRAHRAGRGAEHRPAARAAAAVDRARRARGRRRRRRGLHVARVRRRAAPRLPQALPRDGHRRRPGPEPPGRAARHRRVRPRGRRARRRRGRGAPRGARGPARRRGRLRPGLAVRPPGRGLARGAVGARRGAAAPAGAGGSSASSRPPPAPARPPRRSSSTSPARA